MLVNLIIKMLRFVDLFGEKKFRGIFHLTRVITFRLNYQIRAVINLTEWLMKTLTSILKMIKLSMETPFKLRSTLSKGEHRLLKN